MADKLLKNTQNFAQLEYINVFPDLSFVRREPYAMTLPSGVLYWFVTTVFQGLGII